MKLLLVSSACAHFAMNKPPSWLDPDGTFGSSGPRFVGGKPCVNASTCGWRAAGCTGVAPPEGEEPVTGCISQWYSNGTTIPGNATILEDSPFISYQKTVKHHKGYFYNNPWRAPGTAEVWSPCGIDGGNPEGCPRGNPLNGSCAPGGYGHGPDGRTLKGNTRPAVWKSGGIIEASWGVTANHGGGYQYRLCPKPADFATNGYLGLTEECFQQHPLDFVGDTQWLQWGSNESNRTAISALRLRTGTHPPNSQWTRNPIPACGDPLGGGVGEQYGICEGHQFEPPIPGVKGFYAPTMASPFEKTRLDYWSVVDQLRVPDAGDLPLGDYVLSFRIDCEQTPQVWNQCADVRIVA